MRSVCWICCVMFLIPLSVAYGQFYNKTPAYLKGNSIWTFGRWSGLNFYNGGPTTFRAGLHADEGSASVATPDGQLRFYSNGIRCWNRNNMAMPNGSGLLGERPGSTSSRGTNSAQGVCIVPFINDPDKYYLFCLTPDGSYDRTGYLSYSIVDMSLNNGMGDIVTGMKNVMLDSGLSESMIAIPGNNCDVWLMVHTYDDPVFKAYHITSAGLNTSPVLSVTGNQISGREAYHIGQMAVSPARDKIAITSYHYQHENFDVYGRFHPQPANLSLIGALVCRFDPNTGVVSDAIQIEHKKNCYGVVFSPDNTKLYVNIYYDAALSRGQIVQYEVGGAFDSTVVVSSKQEIRNLGNRGRPCSFKQYNDTIYISDQDYGTLLHRINNPNAAGSACGYQPDAIRLQSGTTQIFQLNNDVVYPFPADTFYTRKDTILCDNQPALSLQAPPGYTFYQWDDLSSGSDRTITESGIYWVAYRNICNMYIDTFVVHLPDTSYYTADSSLCVGGAGLVLYVADGYDHYVWNDGKSDTVRQVDTPGVYWVRSSSYCHTRFDTFYVTETDIRFSLGADTVICDNAPLQLIPSLADAGGDYLWQDGSTDTVYTVTESGEYALLVNKSTCSYADTVRVQYIDIRQDIGNDTIICKNQPFALVLNANANLLSKVLWSDGSTGEMITIHEPGIYWVAVSELSCADTDTLIVHDTLCDCIVEMPTAFSPNGDGRNDRFRPMVEAGCTVRGFTMEVYNRWGQLVYSGTDFSSGWDGTWNGEPADVGAYFYTVRMEAGTDHHLFYKTGDVTLVR